MDIHDPDFWSKVLPEAKRNQKNPLIQTKPRERKSRIQDSTIQAFDLGLSDGERSSDYEEDR